MTTDDGSASTSWKGTERARMARRRALHLRRPLMADVLRVSEVRSFGDRPAPGLVLGERSYLIQKAQSDQIGHSRRPTKKKQKKVKLTRGLAPSHSSVPTGFESVVT